VTPGTPAQTEFFDFAGLVPLWAMAAGQGKELPVKVKRFTSET